MRIKLSATKIRHTKIMLNNSFLFTKYAGKMTKPPKERHHGVTEFFKTKRQNQKLMREMPQQGKGLKARRRRRLNIIMKPNAPQDEERPTPSATVHQPNLLVHKTTTPMKRSAYKSYKSNTAPQKT